MKICKIAAVMMVLVISTSANAAMVSMDLNTSGDGLITHDTVSGLDWLDLSATLGMSYNDALTNNTGWRYASNSEVEGLFEFMFNGYADNTSENSSFIDGTTSTQYMQLTNYMNLFGITSQNSYSTLSSAFYVDEDGIYRAFGGFQYDVGSEVVGIEHTIDYVQYAIGGFSGFGTLMVSTSPVPVPPAAWLFGSGLISLAGFARRKKA